MQIIVYNDNCTSQVCTLTKGGKKYMGYLIKWLEVEYLNNLQTNNTQEEKNKMSNAKQKQLQGEARLLSDVLTVDPKQYITYKPEDKLNISMQLVRFNWKDSNYNTPYVVLTCVEIETGETVTISSGHRAIVDICSKLDETMPTPLNFTFRKEGRTVYMA